MASQYQGSTQLLLRNMELFQSGRWLMVNPEDEGLQLECPEADMHSFYQYYDRYLASSAQNKTFAATMTAEEPFDGVIVVMPKAKEQLKMLLANMAAITKVGGYIALVGANNTGIKSAAKLMQPYSQQVNKVDAARHCSLFVAQIDKAAPAFDINTWWRSTTIDVAGQQLQLGSLPGVFSHGELDAGTELLLGHCGEVGNGKVLDFACGAGVIGLYLAKKNPSIELTMSDINALALYCAERNARELGIEAKVVASHGLQQIDQRFNAIYSNPPFHTGKETDYSISEQLFAMSPKKLLSRGQIMVVANRFLPYAQSLQQHFKQVKDIAKTNKFSLYQGFL